MPTPVRNDSGEYLTVPITMRKLNMCRSKTVKIAADAGALIRYGKSQRINWNKLDGYIQANCIEKNLIIDKSAPGHQTGSERRNNEIRTD